MLVEDLFPTAGTSMSAKARFLGDAVLRLAKTQLNMTPPEDKDSMSNKRVDVSGILMGNLFRDLYNLYRNECRRLVESTYLYGPVRNNHQFTKLINTANINRIFNHTLVWIFNPLFADLGHSALL